MFGSGLLMLMPLLAQAADAEPLCDTGNNHAFLDTYAGNSACALSYLAQPWPDVETWREQGRAKMTELLAYHPAPAPLDAQVLETRQQDGYVRHKVRYQVSAGHWTEAYLLIPDGLSGPAPAVMALHCHSGYYYFGKEKVVAVEHPPQVLQGLIDQTYGGRTFGDALARRGFVVLAPDAFYFGSQRLDPEMLPPHFMPDLKKHAPESDAYIRAFHMYAGAHETLTAKTIFTAGTTWPGILFQGDRASLDYLLTRPEVDPERVGCMGLSIGGFRAAHLFALDPRIKTAVAAGWMTTYRALLCNYLRNHTWMIYVPGQHAWLDLPDAATLNAPQPLMVINCIKDNLFTMDGMNAAEAKIAAVYARMGAPERFQCNYYDEPHSLKIPAQDDAIAWLERWLK